MLKKSTIALVISSMLGISVAYAVESLQSEKVVGFKPKYTNKTGLGSVSGKLQAGETLEVDPNKLGYDDLDGDEHDLNAVKYSWELDGVTKSTTQSITLGNDTVGQKLTLSVTPVSKTGDPIEGDPLVLSDLVAAGAEGGVEGEIEPNPQASPQVTNLVLQGLLAVGEQLTATYTFDANGGGQVDKSTYAWGKENTTAGMVGNGGEVITSGQVPAYTIQASDAGEVLEVSVLPKNDLGKTGEIVTQVADGGVPFELLDPINVNITFESTATVELNGVNGTRPVAGRDELTATFEPAMGASSSADAYMFTWKADGAVIKEASGKGKNTYIPGPNMQGKQIQVDVAIFNE